MNLGDRVTISFDKKQARIEKPMTDEEFFAKLDAMKSEKTKQRIKELAGKTADELYAMAMQKVLSTEVAEGDYNDDDRFD